MIDVERGERIVLLCLAERNGDDYRLSVRPTPLPIYHPLARMTDDEMGRVLHRYCRCPDRHHNGARSNPHRSSNAP